MLLIINALAARNALIRFLHCLPPFEFECPIWKSFPEDGNFVRVESILRLKVASDLSQIVRSPRIHFV